MKITETRTIRWETLRNLCIKKNWYTMGSNDEYGEMLDFASSHEMTTENLVRVASDIIEHSDEKCFEDCEYNGTTAIQYVLFELAEACVTFFNEEKGA